MLRLSRAATRRACAVIPFGVAACITGCAVGPNYVTPDVPVPESFTAGQNDAKGRSSVEADSRWWHSLGDAELNSLIERAIHANLDIAVALSRVQEARERDVAVFGATLPAIGAAASEARGSGGEAVKGRIPSSLDAGTNSRGIQDITGVAGFDAVWEIDLFGKYRRLLEATRYDTQAAIAAHHAALITIIAEVARNYVVLRGTQTRLKVAEENVSRATQTVQFTQAQYNRGITDEFPLSLAKRELASLQSGIAPLTADIAAAKSRLAVLLGTYSQTLDKELSQPVPIPSTPITVRPGRPLDLVRRRPDIRQAERQLASATARIGVATGDLFPRLFLLGGVGIEGAVPQSGSASPFHGAIWSFGPGAYWPLLDFGRLDALVNVAELQTQGVLANYKKTILTAVEEVNQAVKQYLAETERLRNLGTALQEGRRAVELAQQRYDRGMTDFLNVLDAERQQYALRDQYATQQQTVAIQFIALYKALGGGWELYQGLPRIPQPRPAFVAMFDRLSRPGKHVDIPTPADANTR
jgi:NodT family efflux transporter outer membrane factor (OMF) lipoprotein